MRDESRTYVIIKYCTLAYSCDRENCPVRCSGQGLRIEVNGRRVGDFRIVRHSVGSAVEGCPLVSGVPLHALPLWYYPMNGSHTLCGTKVYNLT